MTGHAPDAIGQQDASQVEAAIVTSAAPLLMSVGRTKPPDPDYSTMALLNIRPESQRMTQTQAKGLRNTSESETTLLSPISPQPLSATSTGYTEHDNVKGVKCTQHIIEQSQERLKNDMSTEVT